MTGGLVTRRPTADDHGRVQHGLVHWWGGLGGEAGAQQRALLVPRLFLEHFADTSSLVEDQSHRLVGFLIGFLSQSRPRTAYLHFVGVDPASAGQGIGRRLYEDFFRTVARRGATTVRCITSPGNRASVAFHTRLGFRIEPQDADVVGVPAHLDHDGPGLHRVCFVRELDSGAAGEPVPSR